MTRRRHFFPVPTGVTYVGSVNGCCGDVGIASIAPLLALYPKDGKYFGA